MTYELGDRVQVLLEICNGTPGYGTIVKIKEINNEILYDVRLDWAVSPNGGPIGTLTGVKQINLKFISKNVKFTTVGQFYNEKEKL